MKGRIKMIINNSIEEFQFDGEAMDVLAESPMELSRQTIKSQIDKPESTQDHLIGIIEKIDRTLEIYGGNESDALEIKYNKQEILLYCSYFCFSAFCWCKWCFCWLFPR